MHSIDIETKGPKQSLFYSPFQATESPSIWEIIIIMTLITRTASVFAVAATVLSATSAFATTPFDIATRAHRGQLDGIPGYQSLEHNVTSGRVSTEDIIRAAGETPTPQLEREVSSFLHSLSNDD